MESKPLDIFKRSGDAHLGETLVRLAHLAEQLHRQQINPMRYGALKHPASGSRPNRFVKPVREHRS